VCGSFSDNLFVLCASMLFCFLIATCNQEICCYWKCERNQEISVLVACRHLMLVCTLRMLRMQSEFLYTDLLFFKGRRPASATIGARNLSLLQSTIYYKQSAPKSEQKTSINGTSVCSVLRIFCVYHLVPQICRTCYRQT
jgi:hypothetical protein